MSSKKPLKKFGVSSTHEDKLHQPAKLLILLLLLGQTFYFFVSWIQIYWLNKPINMILTNLASDPPWMPLGQESLPIIGVHHFGDWALLRGWILSGDPYHQFLPAYPPISLLLAEPFTWFSNNTGFFLYIFTTVVVVTSAIYRILKSFDLYLRIQLTLLLGLFNAPTLLIFDRGNNIGLMFGILAWGLIFLQENKAFLSILCLGIGAGMKLYPILIFMPLYFWGFRKIALKSLFLALVVNLLLFARYPMGIIENAKIFYSEVLMGGYTSAIGVSPEFVLNQIGPFSTQLALICQRSDQAEALSYFINLPNFAKYIPILVWIINLSFIPLRDNDFVKLKFSLLLFSLQFLPLMPPYISIWSTFGAAFLLTVNNYKFGEDNALKKRLLYSILGMIVLTLTPLPFTFGDQECGTTLNIFLGTVYFLYFNILLVLINIRSRINSKTPRRV
jgi:hypothetical protein